MARLVFRLLGALVMLTTGVFVALQFPAVQDRLFGRAVGKAMASRHADLFDGDGLKVVFCGTGSPLPSKRRAQTCTAVFAGGSYYLVDAGTGSWETLQSMGVPGGRLGGVFLTHFHSDHIGELGEFNMQSWAQGRGKPMSVYGPPGVERVVAGFAAAYEQDRDYRVAHHGADLMSPEAWSMTPIAVPLDGVMSPTRERRATMLKDGDLTVTAIEMNHSPVEPAYAYRFDYKGRSIVITGDTAKHPPLANAAKDVDVLVHEAQAKHIVAQMIQAAKETENARMFKIFNDIQTYHASPVEAAEIANLAKAKLLVLTHFTPPPNNPLVAWSYMRGVGVVRRDGVVMAEDNMLITLPLAHKDRVEIGRVQ